MQYYFSFFIILAGLPTATESSGISFTTTLPAPNDASVADGYAGAYQSSPCR